MPSQPLSDAYSQHLVDTAVEHARPCAVLGHVPPLLAAGTSPRDVGLAFVRVNGDQHGAGDYATPFSVQSISKLFALALTMAHDGERTWRRVGYRGTDQPYHSLDPLVAANGPPNPFVNAGALLITDRLHTITGAAAAAVVELVRGESGNDAVHIDSAIADAERLHHSHRNAALVHGLAATRSLENLPDTVLGQYTRQCAISASCLDLARAGLLLARNGRLANGDQLLDFQQTRRINGLLSLAGTYAASADFMYRVGLPAKSGIGGGILAIIPDVGALCAWSPGLDQNGNSIAAAAAIEYVVQHSAAPAR